jgi:hypothetical protein
MSLYLLAKKAKRDQMQRARNHRSPFSLFYTNMNSSCQALPRVPTRQKSYNQYQQKKIKQYVEPRVGFKRMPNFSASQHIANIKSEQIRRCPHLPCEKGNVSFDILEQTTLSTNGVIDVDWMVLSSGDLGSTFETALNAAQAKIALDRSKGIMWVGFYTTGDSSFTFSKESTTTSTGNSLHKTYLYDIQLNKTTSCCSSSSRLKVVVTKDLQFNSASDQIAKKKAVRNCCNTSVDENGKDGANTYETPIRANTINRCAT